MEQRTCHACPKTLSARNATGFCNPCLNKARALDPEFRARNRAGIRRKFQDPAHMAKMRRNQRALTDRRMADPAYRAYLVERGKHLRATALTTPEALANLAATRAENGRKRTETVMAWCPPRYRDEYRFLTVSKRVKAAVAKEIIRAKIAAERAAMTPFERAMERIRQGAGIIEVRPIRKAEPQFTLGGVAEI